MNPTKELKTAVHQFPNLLGDTTHFILKFLKEELRSQYSFSLGEEYPSLFKGVPGGSSFFIERDKKIISHVGLIIKEFVHPDFRLKLGLIGSVATRKENRGEGLATQLIQEALRSAKLQGCALAILWSDQPSFYFPMGFYRAGNERDFQISPEKSKGAATVCRLFDPKKDMENLWELYENQSSKLARTFDEMKALTTIPLTQIYVTEKDSCLESYIAINKGADFTHYIHEWAGPVESVRKTIVDCQNRFFPGTPLTLIAPFSKDSEEFAEIASKSWNGALGLVKILEKNSLVSSFETFCKKQSVTVPAVDYQKMTDEECLLAILGRDGEFPGPYLPLFLWGFDSI